MESNEKKNKHMTLDERILIWQMLEEGHSLVEIAKAVGKDPRTISREIKIHRVLIDNSARRGFCGKEGNSPCKILQRFPYVCNGCKLNCIRDHQRYDPQKAQKAYATTLREARSGVDLSPDELKAIDQTIKQGATAGVSVYATLQAHGSEIKVCEKTVYNYVNRGVISTRPIDLKNAVKMKKRHRFSKKYDYKKTETQRAVYAGRSYADYLRHLSQTGLCFRGQMDTVEGTREKSKVLLTLHAVQFHLMLIFLLQSRSSKEVVKALDTLERRIGKDLFLRLFPVILTDRGTEFEDVEGLEKSAFGGKRTKIFFADPYVSCQKGEIESNHRMIRYFLPKKHGMQFELLNDAMVAEMMCRIANYVRKELGGKSPREMLSEVLGEEACDKLEIKKIDPTKINLSMADIISQNLK